MTKPDESIQIDPGFRSLTSDKTKDRERSGGLTKRELFAAMAMQGFMASGIYTEYTHTINKGDAKDVGARLCKNVAYAVVEQADALITALNEGR